MKDDDPQVSVPASPIEPLVDEVWEAQRYRQEHPVEGIDLDFPEDCYENRFDIAFDTDTTPVQYVHIAYAYPSGALCGTKLLWFHGGPLTEAEMPRVTCEVCLHLWKKRGLSL